MPHTLADLIPPELRLDREELVTRRAGYWALRRGQDVFFALAALLLLWPFMAVLALVIWLDDPKGSPIFAQERIGKDGRKFMMYKFRSMCVGAEAMLPDLLDKSQQPGPAFKMKDDPRITRVGRFIRRTFLDELPQLVNILKGEMSFVGPRPTVQRELDQYEPYQRQRLMVTPGLTCTWQIQPARCDMPFETRMAFDLQYIQERSFLMDWKIIFATIKAVFTMQGD